MTELEKTSDNLPQHISPQGRCRYCGAQLWAHLYFCPRCATPYKKVESVLPAVFVSPPSEGQLIAARAPHVWNLFFTYLAVVIGAGILHFIMADDNPAVAMTLGMIAIALTTVVFSVRFWPSLAVQFRRFGFFHYVAWVGLAGMVAVALINTGYVRMLIDLTSLEAPNLREELTEMGFSRAGRILMICVAPAITEEIAFRGLVQHWLQAAISPVKAIMLATALFTALHFSVLTAPAIFLVGLLLGWVKYRTASLYPCMLIHFGYNLAILEFLPIGG